MNIARKALAAAAIAGFGMAGFAAQADAAPTPTPKPRVAKKLAAGDWYVFNAGTNLTPSQIERTAGSQYKLTGKIELVGDQNTQNNFNITYTAAPGNGVFSCVGSGTHGAVGTSGKITWTNVPGATSLTAPVTIDYTITCTRNNANATSFTEHVYLNGPDGHVGTVNDNNQPVLGSRDEATTYTLNQQLPASATPTPSTTAKPSATPKPTSKDNKGGLAKTGL